MAKKPKAQAEPLEDPRTPEEIAEERIAEWKREPMSGFRSSDMYDAKTTWLDLRSLGLKTVPESLRIVHNLELLLIRDNKIKELPRWIGELSKLKGIGLNDNQLQELPPEIGSLSKLFGLGLSGNELEALPEALGTLPLTELSLRGNPKLGIPEETTL